MNNDNLFNLIEFMCGLLDKADVVYAITGSVASSVYAQPQFSWALDVCVQVSPAKLSAFLAALPNRVYHDDDAIREAAARNSMHNLIVNQTGLKVDLSFLPGEGYLGGILARRRQVNFGQKGQMFWAVSPEDIVLMKLLWRKDTHSEKQWENALAVVQSLGVKLEWPYLHRWADQLGLSDDLERLKMDAGI